MLASKIEDFPIFGGSKRPSKFHLFLHRFFIDFGSVLASNMGPSWGPRRVKIRKNGSQKSGWCPPRAVLDTNLLLKTVQEPLGLDFWGVRARFSMIFGGFLRASWLNLGMFSPALSCLGFRRSWGGLQPTLPRKSKNLPRTKPRIQEPAEDKAEKKIRTNAFRKTQISKLSSSKLPSLSQPSLLQKLWAAVLPPGGLQSAAQRGRRVD